ncbi:MAG TPA: helix-hairpin-helix domain-containing protein [Xanthomonadaceae bacterium]|nr:helix-hairpin-helix domain-containing protein [Xanthomonadaceae bacterium]
MKRFVSLLNGLALALLLAGPACAVEKVDINKADAATLDRVLVNIGEAKAEAIVAHRKEHGPFRSAEQLAEVKGIGLKTVENNRDRIVLGAAKAAKAKPKKAKAAAKPATKGKG